MVKKQRKTLTNGRGTSTAAAQARPVDTAIRSGRDSDSVRESAAQKELIAQVGNDIAEVGAV